MVSAVKKKRNREKQDKPFICSVCGKSFIRLWNLNRHEVDYGHKFLVVSSLPEGSKDDMVAAPEVESNENSDEIVENLPTEVATIASIVEKSLRIKEKHARKRHRKQADKYRKKKRKHGG